MWLFVSLQSLDPELMALSLDVLDRLLDMLLLLELPLLDPSSFFNNKNAGYKKACFFFYPSTFLITLIVLLIIDP